MWSPTQRSGRRRIVAEKLVIFCMWDPQRTGSEVFPYTRHRPDFRPSVPLTPVPVPIPQLIPISNSRLMSVRLYSQAPVP